MPTLFRILKALSLVGLAVYGAAYALVNFVEPARRTMITSVPVTFSETQWPATRN